MTELDVKKEPGTDIDQFLDEVDAGLLKTKIKGCIDEIALAVAATGGDGKITLSLSFKNAKGRDEVNVEHKLVSVKPTKRGKQTGEDNGSTPMFIGRHGKVTLYDETQQDMFAEDILRRNAQNREAVKESGETIMNADLAEHINQI